MVMMIGQLMNPFCTSRFAPLELPWLGSADQPAEVLDRVLRLPRSQVLGAHGSGKTTLLAHLERHAQRRGISVLRVRGSQTFSIRHAELLLIDEVEELGRFAVQRARILAWRARAKTLIVSAHRDLGFPTLAHRKVDAELAMNLVRELHPETRVTNEDIEECLTRHDGNLREVFLELYDRESSALSIASSRPASSFDTGGSKSRSLSG